MKIAFFADTYFPHITGVAVAIKYFYDSLRKIGYEVILFAPSVPKVRDEDKNIIRLPALRAFPTLPPQVRVPLIIPTKGFRKIFTKDYEIVHAHGSGTFSLLALIVAKIRKVPILITFHTDWARYAHYVFFLSPGIINWALRQLANHADYNIVPSKKMKQVLEKIGVKKPIEIIPGFIDTQRFLNTPKDYLRGLLGLATDDTILLSVGRFGKEKRFDFLIQIFQKVLMDKPNTHLVLVGAGPERENLKNLAKNLAIASHVHIIGPIAYQDMPKVYADSDLFVFASDTETQGLAVLEAAASGLPLVLYDDPAFSDMAQENVNAFLLPFSESQFSEKILELLENKTLYQKFSENSKKIVKANFEPEIILNKLVKIYEEFSQ